MATPQGNLARVRRATPALALLLALVLAACGGPSGGPNPNPDPTPTNDPVTDSLEALGVDTTATPRKAPDGSDLGEDDAPLGPSASLGEPEAFTDESAANPHMELILANPDIAGSTPVGTTFEVRKILNAAVTPVGDIEFGSESILADLSSGNDWALPDGNEGNQFQTRRAVAAGDLDGDGFDEIAAIFVDATDDVLQLRVFEDAAAGFTARTSSLAAGATVEGLTLYAYDPDGDGRDDLIAAIVYDDRVDLTVFTGSVATSFAIDAGATTTLDPQVAGSTLYVRMSAGQLDYDQGLELGVVVNEFSAGNGLATYYLFDDAAAGRSILRSGSVQANVGGIVAAEAADIKLADVDGDGLDEVILASATNLARSCSDNDFRALLIALDDKPSGFMQLGASVENLFYQNCSSAGGDWKRYFVFLTTPDLDGDGVHEIVANQLVFDNFANAAPFTRLADVELPSSMFLDNLFDRGQYLSVASMEMIAADVTGDGRQNVLLYHQNRSTMPVWGISAVSSIGANGNGWAQLSEIAMPGTSNGQGTARPIIVPANVDEDGPVLKYGAGSYELVFTEPLIIAAMAAPPCQAGIEQNVGACVTRFGQGTSTTVDASLTVTVKASVTTGFEADVNVPFVGSVAGIELRKTVTATASAWAGAAYTVEKTITYTSGSLEDAVVFTSIPYDVYRYDIVSHPDPEFVGKQVVIRVPREPVTMIAERGFFNGVLPSGATSIGGNVFDHTPGDVSSYPSTSRKNALRSQYGGIEFGPSGVGQGTGDTELEIAVSNEISAGGSLGIEYEKSVEVTGGGAIAGFSVGYGAEAALSITSGSQTTYTGIVGSISANDFAENAYQWGIFTYVQSVDGQAFEVINYWVQ
jgi:hypothetical protein